MYKHYLPTTTPTAASAIVIVAWFDFSSWKRRSIKSSHYHAEIRTRAKFLSLLAECVGEFFKAKILHFTTTKV